MMKFPSPPVIARRGQSLVEFALVLPLLMLLLLGIVEFGRAWMTRNIITGAAREAVRLAAVPDPPGGMAAADSRAKQVLASAGLSAESIHVDVDDAPVQFGEVRVQIDYEYPLVVIGFIPGLSGTKISLTSTTTMRREY